MLKPRQNWKLRYLTSITVAICNGRQMEPPGGHAVWGKWQFAHVMYIWVTFDLHSVGFHCVTWRCSTFLLCMCHFLSTEPLFFRKLHILAGSTSMTYISSLVPPPWPTYSRLFRLHDLHIIAGSTSMTYISSLVSSPWRWFLRRDLHILVWVLPQWPTFSCWFLRRDLHLLAVSSSAMYLFFTGASASMLSIPCHAYQSPMLHPVSTLYIHYRLGGIVWISNHDNSWVWVDAASEVHLSLMLFVIKHDGPSYVCCLVSIPVFKLKALDMDFDCQFSTKAKHSPVLSL